MTPQEIRNLRLKNDHKKMVNIIGDIVQWKPIKGTPPYVEEYEVSINMRGIIGNGPRYRDTHVVRVILHANYPSVAPEIRMLSKPFIFHPNWHQDGRWCFGSWDSGEELAYHLLRMMKTIKYDSQITNENSPANSSANEWYVENKDRGIFPCDNKELPNPERVRMTINNSVKKKFDIKPEKKKFDIKS